MKSRITSYLASFDLRFESLIRSSRGDGSVAASLSVFVSGCERSSHGTGASEYHVHRNHHVRGERLQGTAANFKSKAGVELNFIEFFPPRLLEIPDDTVCSTESRLIVTISSPTLEICVGNLPTFIFLLRV